MREIFRDTLIAGSVIAMAVVGLSNTNESPRPANNFSDQNFQAVLPSKDTTRISDPKFISKVPKKIR